MRRELSMYVVKAARRFAANTPLQRLPLTTCLYRKVMHGAYPDPSVTADFRGLCLTMPTHDVTIVPGLLGGFYEEVELDLFERLAGLSRTVVDVGANIGVYTCSAANRQPADGTVVAYEPVPENLDFLRRNIAANAPERAVIVREAAVGAAEGDLELHLADGIGTHSAAPGNARSDRGALRVPLVALDLDLARLGLAGPDLLKVDVEGYDGFVLDGARQILAEARPTLFTEYVPGRLRRCGFDPAEFLDIVFAHYPDVYLTDGPRRRLRRVTRADLASVPNEMANANLVAPGRPDHLKVVEDYYRAAVSV